MASKVSMYGKKRAFLRRFFIHGRMRRWLGFLCAKIQALFIQPTLLPYFISFLPYKRSSYSYVIRKSDRPKPGLETLPTPPEQLWHAYGPTIDEYLSSGKLHVDTMRSILSTSGFKFETGSSVLELGCAAGRMTRWLAEEASRCEIWGTDISSEHIMWCKQNLQPPFNFFVTTTAPHLPFEDGYFDLVYAGSVFSHIDDMADTWLLELRRVLKRGGRLYVTILDNDSLHLLTEGNSDLARTLECHSSFYQNGDYETFAIARFMRSLVFYDKECLSQNLAPRFSVVSFTPGAYGEQTALLLQKR